MNSCKPLFNNKKQISPSVLLLFYSYKTNHSVKLTLKVGVNQRILYTFLFNKKSNILSLATQ